jgi:hypothetical protein
LPLVCTAGVVQQWVCIAHAVCCAPACVHRMVWRIKREPRVMHCRTHRKPPAAPMAVRDAAATDHCSRRRACTHAQRALASLQHVLHACCVVLRLWPINGYEGWAACCDVFCWCPSVPSASCRGFLRHPHCGSIAPPGPCLGLPMYWLSLYYNAFTTTTTNTSRTICYY